MIERLEYYGDKPKSDGDGIVTGYAAVYGKVGDRPVFWEKGAFDSAAESISNGGHIPMLWQHDSWDPIGKWTEATVDGKGLLLRGPLSLGVQKGQDARELLKDEVVTGLSIGFIPTKQEEDEDTGMRHIFDADIPETSLVTFPAMTDARVTSVQKTIAGLESIRDWEAFLRDAGLSRSAAKALLAKGYAGLNTREAEEETAQLVDAIRRATERLTS